MGSYAVLRHDLERNCLGPISTADKEIPQSGCVTKKSGLFGLTLTCCGKTISDVGLLAPRGMRQNTVCKDDQEEESRRN